MCAAMSAIKQLSRRVLIPQPAGQWTVDRWTVLHNLGKCAGFRDCVSVSTLPTFEEETSRIGTYPLGRLQNLLGNCA